MAARGTLGESDHVVLESLMSMETKEGVAIHICRILGKSILISSEQ